MGGLVSTVAATESMAEHSNPLKSFTATRLPWAVALGMGVLYLLTLHSWISFASLPAVSDIGGWTDRPQFEAPLLYLLTLPLRVLPASVVPVAMNALAALFGALTLALMVRSVLLLPHDRTKEQRQREQNAHSLLSLRSNWVPALFAALVCGLQLSFWQHATAGTGEMLNVLLFAFVIRCLLEYRIDHKTRWLTRAVLVYAIGITNNWGMVGFLPLFGVALLWTARMRLFQEGLPLKLALNGLAGLSLYLLLPLTAVISGSGESFTDVLMANLGWQKSFLGSLFSQRLMVMVMASTAILPLLLVSIRWPAAFGDTNAAASAITSGLLRLVHFLFLAVCVYVAFDHVVSPRKLVNLPQITGIGAPFLTFYYLGALSIGYFLGYLLLLSGKEDHRQWRKPSELAKALNRGLYIGLQIAALVVIAVLAWRNLGTVIVNNKNDVASTYAKWLAANLPEGKAILFTDNDMTPQSQLLRAELARSGAGGQTLLVETHKLQSPEYQSHLAKRDSAWPELPEEVARSKTVDKFLILDRLEEINAHTPVYYLHPSFGYFFERFYPEPVRGIFQLLPYPSESDSLDKPPLTREQVDASTALAENVREQFDAFADQSARLQESRFPDSLIIMGWLSRNLNQRGVDLARDNQPKDAEKIFLAACNLYRGNPKGNLLAQANLRQITPKSDYEFYEKLDQLVEENKLFDANGDGGITENEIDYILRKYGPIDEPQTCFQLGRFFAKKTDFHEPQVRQAYQEVTRAAELATTFPDPIFFIAEMFLSNRLTEKAKLFIERLATMNEANPFTPDQQIKLIQLRADILLVNSGPAETEKYLLDQLKPHMNSIPGFHTMLAFHLNHDQKAKALNLLDKWLSNHPDDLNTLIDKGHLLTMLQRYDEAVEVFESGLPRANSQEKPNLISLIAGTYAEKGNFGLALQNIDDAIGRTGADKFKFQKAQIYQLMAKHEDAISIFTELIENGIQVRDVYSHRANSYMATKQYDDAKADYEKLQAFYPDAPGIYLNLAQIAEAKSHSAEALKNYELYLKYADPESIPVEEMQPVQTRVKQLKQLQGDTP
jgi:tetratricopeptide (TPR) repeat protein